MANQRVTLVDYESEHITFRTSWHAAQILWAAGQKDESNGFWSVLAAAVLVHTAFEGFLNDVIARACPDAWQSVRATGEYRGTLGKTRFLAQEFAVPLDPAQQPYRSLAELHARRNELVHPETVRCKGVTTADSYAKDPRRALPLAFTRLQQDGFMTTCFDDLAALADTLLEAAALKHSDAVRDLGGSAFWGPTGHSGASLKRRTTGVGRTIRRGT
jgi:hypothetical protein